MPRLDCDDHKTEPGPDGATPAIEGHRGRAPFPPLTSGPDPLIVETVSLSPMNGDCRFVRCSAILDIRGARRPTPMIEPIARVRIVIEDTDPPVWRELDVPLSTTLAGMHDIIQVVMGWWDYHLYEFEIGDRFYGVPSSDDALYDRKVYKASALRLATVLERGVRDFLYVYDFGDNWRHRISVMDVRQGVPDLDYPRFIAGARRAPPEDVGSISGFEEFLGAIADPEHEQHERMLEWYGQPFDPEDIEEPRLHRVMANFAARRRGPLMRHRGTGQRAGDGAPS